ncbi:hypothetical protein ACLB1T_20950 [Escherichia coli]
MKPGETALVELGNVAELYITFFALLKLGVAPVLALFAVGVNELNAYASQIEPALLIADRQHALFSGDRPQYFRHRTFLHSRGATAQRQR